MSFSPTSRKREDGALISTGDEMVRQIAATLLASAASISIAHAADPIFAPEPSIFVEPVVQHYKDWSGAYFGAVGSVGMYTNEASDYWCNTACDAADMGSWGGGVGLTVGWNRQHRSLVYGVEGDISWTGFKNSLDVDNVPDYFMEHRASMDWLATLRGRIGVAAGKVLAYVTGGVAIANLDYSSWYVPPYDDEGFRTSDTQVGLAAGVGVEVAVSDRMSIKGEYLYVGFPDQRTQYFDGVIDPRNDMVYRSDLHMLRFGLNYQLYGGNGSGGYGGATEIAGPDADWSGAYVGLVGTAGMFANDMSDQWCVVACDAPDMASWGAGIGATAGWNRQVGAFVYGVEGDISWTNFENSMDTFYPGYLAENRASWEWLATLRGRAGLASGNVLTYVTGGIAIAATDYSSIYLPGEYRDGGFFASQTQVGLAAGAGVEVALSDRWSFKGEYLFVGFPDVVTDWTGDPRVTPGEDVMTYRSHAHMVRLGLNYRFYGSGMPQRAAPTADWSGLYAGAVGGAALFTNEMSDQWCMTACDAPDMASWGGTLGATAGWNAQNGALVYGVEGDVAWTSFDNQLDVLDGGGNLDVVHKASWNWLATLRGRAGLASGNVLAYVTGGVAFAGTDYSSWYVGDDEGFATSQTQVGIAAGAGVEVALTENVSAKGEYLYVGLPDVTTDYQNGGNPGEDVMTYRSSAHIMRFGVNYHF